MHNSTIHREFERQVQVTPNNVAVSFGDVSLEYQQLDAKANFVAAHLQSSGVNPGDIVAVALSHSVELVVSLLAVAKCGAAYLPIDSANPMARNQLYLEQAQVNHIIVGDNSLAGEPFVGDGQYCLVNISQPTISQGTLVDFISHDSHPDDKAYVMFTSGSTGKPKGVVVPHRAVVRLVRNSNFLQILPSDRVLQLAPPSFDASTLEFWGSLLNGATLVPYSGSVLDPNQLRSDIEQNKITILWLTAALFHLVVDRFIDAFEPLRVLLAGGDVLNAKHINKVFDQYPAMTVINGYGPTENTTFTCCHVMTCKNRPIDNVLIGKAISGTNIHILDDTLNPVAVDETGQLFVSGAGVALGYLGDADSNDAFFTAPDLADGLIYGTGDLVKQNSAGELSFIGRKDNQVKIRGYRVSLEEIKSYIVGLEEVSDAFVVKKSFSEADQIIQAYVKLQDNQQLSIKEIKVRLSELMPKYMIPGQFIFNQNLPINENGKIDKQTILDNLN